MSEEPKEAGTQHGALFGPRTAALIVVAFGAAALGSLAGRWFAPGDGQSVAAPARPIVQIVRTPSFPSVAATVDKVCPAIARIVQSNGQSGGAPAFGISSDGWLVAAAKLPPSGELQAVFGDGRKEPITDIRTDPVSGLVIAHADATGIPVLSFADQTFARIGDFGMTLQSPNGSGCSAETAMVASDFLVDASAQGIYVRLQASGAALAPGTPYLAADGSVIGIATGTQGSTVLPAPIAALIVNELIRDQLSPIGSFGFRAIDFTPELGARLGSSRRGVGVALVQQSAAAGAALQAGDTIVAVDGSPVSSTSELSRALDAVTGSSTTLQVERGSQQLSIKVSRSS